jgi:hypothetical protein
MVMRNKAKFTKSLRLVAETHIHETRGAPASTFMRGVVAHVLVGLVVAAALRSKPYNSRRTQTLVASMI